MAIGYVVAPLDVNALRPSQDELECGVELMHSLEGVADAEGRKEGVLLTPPSCCLPTAKYDDQYGIAKGTLGFELVQDQTDQRVVKLQHAQDGYM